MLYIRRNTVWAPFQSKQNKNKILLSRKSKYCPKLAQSTKKIAQMLPKLSKSAQIALKKRKRALCRKIETVLKKCMLYMSQLFPGRQIKGDPSVTSEKKKYSSPTSTFI